MSEEKVSKSYFSFSVIDIAVWAVHYKTKSMRKGAHKTIDLYSLKIFLKQKTQTQTFWLKEVYKKMFILDW